MTGAGLQVRNSQICFSEPLTRAVIVARRNRFVIDVEIDGALVACHCPTTGRIGNLVLDDLACLLSQSTSSSRATPYTVEAISVDPPDTPAPTWIGINQNAANRFVECALHHGLLPEIVIANTVRREQVLGKSRLDFLINDDTYVEVKSPLQNLQVDLGDHVRTRPHTAFDSTDRMVKHLDELARSLAAHQRAILLLCFLYDNPGFEVLPSQHHAAVKRRVTQAIRRGVELWQVNFEIDETGVRVLRYHRLDPQFTGQTTRKPSAASRDPNGTDRGETHE